MSEQHRQALKSAPWMEWTAREEAAFEEWWGSDSARRELGLGKQSARAAWLVRAMKDVLAFPFHGEPAFDFRVADDV